MNKYKNFKKLSKEQTELTYGGWAWLTASLPHMISAAKWTATAAIGYKAITADSGQIKFNGMDAKWDNEVTEQSSSAPKVVYYPY